MTTDQPEDEQVTSDQGGDAIRPPDPVEESPAPTPTSAELMGPEPTAPDGYEEHLSFEFTDGVIPLAAAAERYEKLAPGAFRSVFLPAYVDDRKLIIDEATYRRERDIELRAQARIDQERNYELALRTLDASRRGQTLGFIVVLALLVVVLVITLAAILSGQEAVAIASLAIIGGGFLVAVRQILNNHSPNN